MPLDIIRNDITKVRADAIVNTANPHVAIGEGTDRAIYEAAGKEQLLEERAKIGDIQAGNAAYTPAFALDAKYIIHTVGPAWRGGRYHEKETAASCYRNSLKIADKLGCETVAFPLISTGTYGFPKDEALRIAVDEISSFLFNHDMTVYLVVYDRESFVISGKAFAGVRTYIAEHEVKPRTFTGCGNRARRLEDSGFGRNLLHPKKTAASTACPDDSPISYIAESEHSDDSSISYIAEVEHSDDSPIDYIAEAACPEENPNYYTSALKPSDGDSAFYTAAPDHPDESTLGYTASPDHRDKIRILYSDTAEEYSTDTQAAEECISDIEVSEAMMFAGETGTSAVQAKPAHRELTIDDIIGMKEETFQQVLFRIIDQKGMTDPEVYKKSNIDRKLFSKIRSDVNYTPSKKTVMALIIGLELNVDEAKDLLNRSGYSFSPADLSDLTVKACIEQQMYNIHIVNCYLFDLGQKTLGT